MTIVVEN